MNVNLSKELGSSIIKVKATKIKKGSIVTVGAITKTLWSSFNFATPKSWLLAIHKGELFFYNNKGIVYGEKKNQLKTFSQGSAFDVSVKNNVMTITMNKKNAEFNLPKEK